MDYDVDDGYDSYDAYDYDYDEYDSNTDEPVAPPPKKKVEKAMLIPKAVPTLKPPVLQDVRGESRLTTNDLERPFVPQSDTTTESTETESESEPEPARRETPREPPRDPTPPPLEPAPRPPNPAVTIQKMLKRFIPSPLETVGGFLAVPSGFRGGILTPLAKKRVFSLMQVAKKIDDGVDQAYHSFTLTVKKIEQVPMPNNGSTVIGRWCRVALYDGSARDPTPRVLSNVVTLPASSTVQPGSDTPDTWKIEGSGEIVVSTNALQPNVYILMELSVLLDQDTVIEIPSQTPGGKAKQRPIKRQLVMACGWTAIPVSGRSTCTSDARPVTALAVETPEGRLYKEDTGQVKDVTLALELNGGTPLEVASISDAVKTKKSGFRLGRRKQAKISVGIKRCDTATHALVSALPMHTIIQRPLLPFMAAFAGRYRHHKQRNSLDMAAGVRMTLDAMPDRDLMTRVAELYNAQEEAGEVDFDKFCRAKIVGAVDAGVGAAYMGRGTKTLHTPFDSRDMTGVQACLASAWR